MGEVLLKMLAALSFGWEGCQQQCPQAHWSAVPGEESTHQEWVTTRHAFHKYLVWAFHLSPLTMIKPKQHQENLQESSSIRLPAHVLALIAIWELSAGLHHKSAHAGAELY